MSEWNAKVPWSLLLSSVRTWLERVSGVKVSNQFQGVSEFSG
jgi:hypothetical protein